MITIPQSLARHLRAVFRRLVKNRGDQLPVIHFFAGSEGLRVRAVTAEAAAEYHEPGAYADTTLTMPLHALAECEGRSDCPVRIEVGRSKQVQLHWQQGNIPQVREYEAADLPAFPAAPDKTTANPPGLWTALADAAQSAAKDGIRFALHHLQLRGRGEIVGTDGRQLLIQRGFTFPWNDNLLIPALPILGCRELCQDTSIQVGRTERVVFFGMGPWSFFLSIDAQSRFPRVEDVVPKATAAATHWQIHPDDAAFLAQALKNLPDDNDDTHPLTVDLNGKVRWTPFFGQKKGLP